MCVYIRIYTVYSKLENTVDFTENTLRIANYNIKITDGALKWINKDRYVQLFNVHRKM